MASALKKFRMLEQQQEEEPAAREPDPKPAKKNKLSMYSHIFSSFESSDSPDELRRKTIEKVREEKRQAETRKKEKLEEEKRRREEEIERPLTTVSWREPLRVYPPLVLSSVFDIGKA